MYRYDAVDQKLVDERVAEFRDQVARRLDGRLSEDEFRGLRLRNGLYKQRYAYMLRVAIPYGLLSTRQLRMLAHIARRYDKGFGHFTTRQNIQYNWPTLEDAPDILADLATVEMHAIQTSGNCVRNITTDHLAGIAADELEDPRAYCEIMRQWSTLHPEFNYLPRKFKIAFSGAATDRAAIAFHDIGFRFVRDAQGALCLRVLVGGGMGRTPVIGAVIHPCLPVEHMLSYTEAILRVYNLHGHRDNLWKARIKILVRELGAEAFGARVNEEWVRIKDGDLRLRPEDIARMKAYFAPPDYESVSRSETAPIARDPAFARWASHNVTAHKAAGYAAVWVSLKAPGVAPGDATAEQMEAVADIADRFSFGTVRTTHDQNLLLPDVRRRDLQVVWAALAEHGLATPNIGTLTNQICCPGLDFCDLANAGSIPVAKAVAERFDDLAKLQNLGEVQLKMSGCINACGHHHVGHIGILGIDKKGEEFYQIMLGGSAGDDASLGRWIGPAIPKADVPEAVDRVLSAYVDERREGERFLETVRRVGLKPFAAKVYGSPSRE